MDRFDLIGRTIPFYLTNTKVEFESSVSTTQVTCALAFLIQREFRKQPCIDKYEKEEMMKLYGSMLKYFVQEFSILVLSKLPLALDSHRRLMGRGSEFISLLNGFCTNF